MTTVRRRPAGRSSRLLHNLGAAHQPTVAGGCSGLIDPTGPHNCAGPYRASRHERSAGNWAHTKEKAGCWTRQRAFAQVRLSSNIQLLPYPLVTAVLTVPCDLREGELARRLAADPW
jgi:hypothetical protein